ncbi:SDR family NAD(P)-dependent oxidoreductase [Streptomyces sp. GKU 257-1]|nr:SDR family NAD(P)-dependent oxidoreductase [Streptomyces sp. GKU 257-1]
MTTGAGTVGTGALRTVSPGDPDAFRTVLADVGPVDRVHLLVGAEDPHARVDADVQLLALRLLRAPLSERNGGERIDCHLTTHDTHGTDGRAANATGAGLTGLAYFLAQQRSRYAVRNVDVSARETDLPALAAALIAEPASPAGELTLLRAGRRYRQRFDEVEPPGGESGLRTGGAYLVIGGAGVVGQSVTRHLHEHYRARVAWVGRRPGDDAAVRAALDAATVGDRAPAYLRADVTDPEQVRSAVAQAKEALGALHGVVFAGASTITEQAREVTALDDAEFRHHYEVKARGAVHVAGARWWTSRWTSCASSPRRRPSRSAAPEPTRRTRRASRSPTRSPGPSPWPRRSRSGCSTGAPGPPRSARRPPSTPGSASSATRRARPASTPPYGC